MHLKQIVIISLFTLFILKLEAQSSLTLRGVQKISNTSGSLGNVISSGGRFGNRIANMGDLNSDGVVDLAVGEEYADDGGTDKGAVWILFMTSNGTVKSKQKISETNGNLGITLNSGTRFGFSVANLGDINSDGVNDLAVGSVVENSFSGAIWILFLKSDGTVKSTAKIDKYTSNFTTLDNYDIFANDLAGIGDVNGDGVNDLVSGAPQDDDGGTDKGAVYIIFLNSNGSVKGYQKISANYGGFNATLDASDFFGGGVAAMGDLNSDGVPDIGVGAFFDDDGNQDAGAVYLINLKSDGTVKSYNKISNNNLSSSNVLASTDLFGRALSATSDKNGDGIKDLIVGALQDNGNGSDRGAIYIIYLNSNQTVKSYQKLNSQTSGLSSYLSDGDKFGGSVTSLDNFAQGEEVTIASGAIFDDDGYSDAGAVYLMFFTPPTPPDLSFTKFTMANDSICGDSSTSATVYLKNNGKTALTNFKIEFVIKSDISITQTFTYPGTIAASGTLSFPLKLNLYNGGLTNITAYTISSKDTVPSNDTFKSSVYVLNIIPKFATGDVCLGEKTIFTNNSTSKSADTVKYIWDFGDGTTSTDLNTEHTYSTAGTYTVKLTAWATGCSKSITNTVNVFAMPKIIFGTGVNCLGTEAKFKAIYNLYGEKLNSITWNFGDGDTDTGESPSHIYKSAGIFTVTATIKTVNGCTGEYKKTIIVDAIPETGYSRSNDTLYSNAASAGTYQWYKNGTAITGANNKYYVLKDDGKYTVLVSSSGGCKDSAVSKTEYVKNYLSGVVNQSNGQPLKMSMVIMAKVNLADTLVSYLDTVWTDQNGAYNFTTREKNFYLFAVPTINLYPGEVLTYYENGLTIQDATELYLEYGLHVITFSTQKLEGVTGKVYVRGNLTNCKSCSNASQAVEGLPIILVDESNKPIVRLQTSANGNFTLPALSNGKYYLWADKLFINNSVAPLIEIDTTKVLSTRLMVSLHPTYLVIDETVGFEQLNKKHLTVSVFPNPSAGKYNIKVDAPGTKTVNITVSSINGKILWSEPVAANSVSEINIDKAPAGIYFLKIQGADFSETVKLIKQ